MALEIGATSVAGVGGAKAKMKFNCTVAAYARSWTKQDRNATE